MVLKCLSIAADILGIISFFLTIFLIIKSETLRKEIAFQKSEYTKNQGNIKINMIALRDNLLCGQSLSPKIASEIRTQFYYFEQSFGHLLTHKDKQHLRLALQMLSNQLDTINKEKLCHELDYFIARFERRELQ